jgi:hypothetical protein
MPILNHQTQKADEGPSDRRLSPAAPHLLKRERLVRPSLQDEMVVKVSDHPQNIRFSDGLEEGAARIHLVGALPLMATGAVQLLRF